MPRLTAFLIFFLVACSILGGTHYYFWARLVRDTGMPAPWRQLLGWGLLLLAVGLPLSLVSVRLAPPVARLLAWPAGIWMGLMFFLFVLLVAGDLLEGLGTGLRLALGTSALDPQRRLFLARALGGSASVLAAGAAVAGIRSALAGVEVRQVSVELARLPKGMHGTTLVQLSDLHVGPTIGRSFVEEVVRRANALSPDLIAITGDLVDGSVEELREAVAPLAGLKARHGVFFVTGNHEYYSGVDGWLEELPRLGIRVLRNERVSIGEGGEGFDLAGVDDWTAHQFGNGHGADLPRALAGRDPSRELVLMAHQPKAVHEAARLGVGLQLAGHTHGGQIWPFGYLVALAQPFIAGLGREGDTQIYVSRGTGYWGPPMRLGAPAEITRIVLRAPVSRDR